MRKIYLTFALCLLVYGCASFRNHGFEIVSQKPSKYNIGINPKIAIIDVKGGIRSLEDTFTLKLVKELNNNKADAVNKISSGIKLEIANRSPKIENALGDNYYYLSANIVDKEDKEIEKEVKSKIKKDGKEVEQTQNVKFITSTVSLEITLVDKNRVVFDREIYKAYKEWEKSKSPSERDIRYESVIEDIAKKVAVDITPRSEKKFVQMDNSDELEQGYVDLVKSGNSDKAIEEMEKSISTNPKAIRYYNLAVLYDAKSNYEKALNYYTKAIELNPEKKLYQSTKVECENRFRYFKELMQN